MTAIQTSDMLYRLSVSSSPGNANAQVTLTASYGGYLATTAAPVNALNQIFPATTALSESTYRCLFLVNNTASGNTFTGGTVYLVGGYHSAAGTVSIGVDTTAASPVGSSTAQALTSTSGTAAPAGVTFSSPTSASTGLVLGDIPPGYCKAVWIRRVTPASAVSPQFTELINLGVSGNSAA